jgi:hypothetical protein
MFQLSDRTIRIFNVLLKVPSDFFWIPLIVVQYVVNVRLQ